MTHDSSSSSAPERSRFVNFYTRSHHPGTPDSGSGSIDSLVTRSRKLGSPLVITNPGSLAGTRDIHTKAMRAGVKPIIGCEVFVATDLADGADRGRSIVLIAVNGAGYQSLCKITSQAWIEHFSGRPRVDRALLAQHTEGLVCLTGPQDGYVAGQRADTPSEDEAEIEHMLNIALVGMPLAQLIDIYGHDNVYMQIDMGASDTTNELMVQVLLERATCAGIKAIPTALALYANAADAPLHACAAKARRKDAQNPRPPFSLYRHTQHLLSADEMLSRLIRAKAASPHALLAATYELADRIEPIEFELQLGPEYPFPRRFKTAQAYALHLAEEGLKHRVSVHGLTPDDEHRLRKRAHEEIEKLGAQIHRILWYWNICHLTDRAGILRGPGRGSAAGSALLYLLRVTHINPLDHDLIFERLWNPSSAGAPIIDIDFEHERQGDVVEIIRARMDEVTDSDRAVAFVGRANNFTTKSARKAAEQVLGIKIEQYAVEDNYEELDESDPEFFDKYKTTAPKSNRFVAKKELQEDGIAIADYLRNTASAPPSGPNASKELVISDIPLDEQFPLQTSRSAHGIATITGWTQSEVQAAGAFTFHVLGLRALTDIARMCKAAGIEDPYAIPVDDEATYAWLSGGGDVHVFGMKEMTSALQMIRPTSIYDLEFLMATHRPGPMSNIPAYANRKNQRETVVWEDDRLKESLGMTYGIAAYQEQLMHIAHDLGDFTMQEADDLRKVLGKKLMDRMPAHKAKFVQAASAKVGREVAELIWERDFVPSADYSFNRAHAAAYARLAYISAYLHVHYGALVAAS